MELQQIIEAAWNDRSLLQDKDVKIAIKSTIDDLDRGKKRVAEPQGNDWVVH
ncbi:MAG: 2,3,4,5-tetrahydropyridine-2,6-dicarboxylate N-succinyltransferase, partial [Bacteroidota bacterium]